MSPEELDVPLSDMHMVMISELLEPRRVIASLLGLNEVDQEDIESDSDSSAKKRVHTLRKWKAKLGYEASYKKLIDAFLALGIMQYATVVLQILISERGRFIVLKVASNYGHHIHVSVTAVIPSEIRSRTRTD